MSKAADLNNNDEYESASPEKKIGDTEVQVDEGEESDEYEEIDDEVCVQGNNIYPRFKSSIHFDRRKGR